MSFFATHYWTIVFAILGPGILYASWIDYSQRRVPNWLNASLAAAGLLAQGLAFGLYTSGENGVLGGVGWGLLGLLVGFGVLIVPWAMHGMGAGDVKLMAAIGCWLGPWLTLMSFAVGAIIGGIAAVIMIYTSGRTVHAFTNMQMILTKMRRFDTAFGEFGGAKTFGDTSQLLPYGVPLTAGTWLVLLTYYFGGWLT
jgi:prepilin peptidase CpaA